MRRTRAMVMAAAMAAAVVAAGSVPAEAQDRSRAARCIDGRYHRYGVSFPLGNDWPTFRATLFFENRNGFFLAILFDEDGDVVVSSATHGRITRSRFLHMAANVTHGRYELWVSCIDASSNFRLATEGGRTTNMANRGTGRFLTTDEQLGLLDREAVFERYLEKMQR